MGCTLIQLILENAGFENCTDGGFDEGEIYQILENIVSRRYNRNGFGGLFPLKRPRKDQRKVQSAEEHDTSPQLVAYYINTFIKNEATEEDIAAFNNKNKEKTKMENDLDLAADKIYRDKRAEKKKESLASLS